MRFLRPLALAALAFTFGGCGLFADDPTVIDVTGTVVAADTGQPVQGLSIELDSGQGIVHSTVATTYSGQDGRFRLSYDTRGANFYYTLFIGGNEHVYGSHKHVEPGEQDLGVIRLNPRPAD